jgi:alpha-1,2-mannosyltransferase
MILLPVTSIDFNYYREPTAPFVNILTYNTGNKGDELYGIEPISYYVKNLLLTTGLAFLLACLAPVMEIVQLAQSFLISSEKFPPNRMDSYIFTIYLSAALWLGVLFSRPHKEERFLYPAYPLLAFAAARSMLIILHSLKGFVIVALPISRDTKSSIGRHLQEFVHRLLVIVMLAIFTLRIFANIRNYYGYMATWRDLNHQLIHSSEYLSKAAAYPASLTKPLRSYEDSIRVCTGSEWHLFPTHFFLPNAATVFYIEDNFHGILPQHFEAINGTFRVPPLPNNGDNEEEINRYIGIDECHYIVSSKDAQEFANRLPTATNSGQSSHLYLSVISSRPVLNRDDTSINALLRAFYLPSYLQRFGTVSFKPYQVLKVVNGGQNAQLRSPTFSEYRRMPVKEPSEKGVGKSFLGSLFSSVGSRKMKVKDEMTKEQLAKKLGLAERKKLKYEQNDNAESSEL